MRCTGVNVFAPRLARALEEIGDQGLIFGCQRLAAELFEGGLAAGPKVELELVSKIEQVAPGMAIAACELLGQVFDSRLPPW